MKNFLNYMKLSRAELSKVIFPTKEQVRGAYITVFIVVLVVALFLALVDVSMSSIISSVLR